MRILFIGDIFGEPGIKGIEGHLPKIINKEKIDFVVAQGENVSGRKGLIPSDYQRLKKAGINAFTMGNHVWAKEDIKQIINNQDIIRPYNINNTYQGSGSRVFVVRGQKIRVTSMLGIDFNELRDGWNDKTALNFFDSFDQLMNQVAKDEFHILDFHGEVTSEKAVFGLYVDGKINAFVSTHTHVQTNDAHTLPKGTVFITDVGMTGPIDSAIGANFEEVYRRMRFGEKAKFQVSNNPVKMHAVIVDINKKGNFIKPFNKDLR